MIKLAVIGDTIVHSFSPMVHVFALGFLSRDFDIEKVYPVIEKKLIEKLI